MRAPHASSRRRYRYGTGRHLGLCRLHATVLYATEVSTGKCSRTLYKPGILSSPAVSMPDSRREPSSADMPVHPSGPLPPSSHRIVHQPVVQVRRQGQELLRQPDVPGGATRNIPNRWSDPAAALRNPRTGFRYQPAYHVHMRRPVPERLYNTRSYCQGASRFRFGGTTGLKPCSWTSWQVSSSSYARFHEQGRTVSWSCHPIQ